MNTSEPGAFAPGGPMSAAYRPLTIGLLAIITCAAFEAMAVATAMPLVAKDLGGLTSYGLAFSLFLTGSLLGTVIAGSWTDIKGPRPALIVGLSLMVGGLLVAGAAGDFSILTLGRAVSGLGAGLMIVAVYVIIGQVFPSVAQPTVFGWLAAAWVLPALIGPYLSGLLAQYVSWRLVFVSVAPIVVLAVVLVWPKVKRLGAPEFPSMNPAQGRRRSVLGVFLAVGVFAAQWAAHGFAAPDGVDGPAAYLLAALLLAGVAAASLTLPRLLPKGSLRFARGLPSIVLNRGLMTLAFFGAEAFIPLMLVDVRGLDASTAGLALTGAAIGWSAGSFTQARFRFERAWLLVSGGALLTMTMTALALLASPAVPVWVLVVVWAVSGYGMGMGMSTSSVLTLKLSPSAERGRNSSSLQLSDMLGGVVGTAGAGTVYALLWDRNIGESTGVFVVIWASLAVFSMLAAVAGLRARRHETKTEDSKVGVALP
ncbi:MFS transporter [Arthrobacter sp. H14]|uniref:MFS transporter n=1 Tax=Arthrobacter sp. H14 TaxID=1312959 RepID=UPI0012DE34B3|nr:MFS transporter [Arthrobacter sp. H14]